MTDSAPLFDPRVPPRERCVTRYLIDNFAAEKGTETFAVFQDGEIWSYEQLREKVRQLAGGFHEQGVSRGDHVAVWMFDSKEAILTFFAINYLGAVFVLGVHYVGGKGRRENLLLTITGDAEKYFGEESGGALAVVDELVGSYSLQRFDIEGNRGQVRIVVNQASGSETAALVAKLRKRLPECEFSYVNLESTL